MSTRASLYVVSGPLSIGWPTVQLYRHQDGYPRGTVPIILDAEEHFHDIQEAWKRTRPGYVAAMLCAAALDRYGPGIAPEARVVGPPADVEYVYALRVGDAPDAWRLRVYERLDFGRPNARLLADGPPAEVADAFARAVVDVAP